MQDPKHNSREAKIAGFGVCMIGGTPTIMAAFSSLLARKLLLDLEGL
jgi:hypothetical protein